MAPKCPKCGNEMLLKISKQQIKFWGCKDFPKCKGSMDFTSKSVGFGKLISTFCFKLTASLTVLVGLISWPILEHMDSRVAYNDFLIAITSAEPGAKVSKKVDLFAWQIAKRIKDHQESHHLSLWDSNYKETIPDINPYTWLFDWKIIKSWQVRLEKDVHPDFDKYLQIAKIVRTVEKEHIQLSIVAQKGVSGHKIPVISDSSVRPQEKAYFVFSSKPRSGDFSVAMLARSMPAGSESARVPAEGYIVPAPDNFNNADEKLLIELLKENFRGYVDLDVDGK